MTQTEPTPKTESDEESASAHDLLRTVERNWSLEMDGTAMYGALADREKLPERKSVFQKLSDLERKHAGQWAKRIQELGGEVPATHSGKAHAIRVADTPGGMREILLAIEQEERQDVGSYLKQMREIDDEATRTILREVVLDEFTHAHVLHRLYAESSPRSALDYLARRQRQGTGSWIGDAVYGINDGLGSIFGIVSGVSGATLGNSKFVILAGVAGMVASALSMGSGAYLAAKSEREIYEAELQRERDALKENPKAAEEEMALFYQLKGVPEKEAVKIAGYLSANQEQFLKTMAAEKLSLTEDGLSNPLTSALSGSAIDGDRGLHSDPSVLLSEWNSRCHCRCDRLADRPFRGRRGQKHGYGPLLVEQRLGDDFVGAVEGIVTYIIGIGLGHIGA